jgi:oxygen-independent coproporphyrinogen-3 oxidase
MAILPSAFWRKTIDKRNVFRRSLPYFFSSETLTKLMNGLLEKAIVADTYEFSFEGHPNHTFREQLETLYNLGE